MRRSFRGLCSHPRQVCVLDDAFSRLPYLPTYLPTYLHVPELDDLVQATRGQKAGRPGTEGKGGQGLAVGLRQTPERLFGRPVGR